MQFSSDMPMIGVSLFYCLKSRKRLFAGKQGRKHMNKIIELKNISKSFDGETVLDGISLDIHDNDLSRSSAPPAAAKRRRCASSAALKLRIRAT